MHVMLIKQFQNNIFKTDHLYNFKAIHKGNNVYNVCSWYGISCGLEENNLKLIMLYGIEAMVCFGEAKGREGSMEDCKRKRYKVSHHLFCIANTSSSPFYQ